MSEWKEYKLGQIGFFNNGVNKDKYSFGHGYPFVNLMDIFDKDTISQIPKGLVDVSQDELNRYNLKDGDILFVRSSVKLEGVGKVCSITKDLENTIYSGFIIRYRQPELIIDKLFASYYLNSSPIRTKIIAKATLSANSNVNQESLKTIPIKIPLIPEQQQIAKILSTADAVIEKTQAAIDKYKAIKQGMLHDLFTRGIDISTGKLRPKYEDAPELYKESKLGMIPREWDEKTIEEIGNVVTGSTPSTAISEYYGNECLFVSPADIQQNLYISNTEKKLTQSGFDTCRKLTANTICVVCIGSTIGKIALLKTFGCTNQQINSVICFDPDLSFFYYYAMTHYNEQQFGKETGLQAVPIVNKSSFSKFALPKATKDEATEISKRLLSIDDKLQAEQNYLLKIQKIKSGLMSDLLSGKKRVIVKEK